MLVLRDRLITIPIMSLQTGSQLGVTTAPIIDPRRLHILAFYCEGPGIDFQPAILHTSDIRDYSDVGIIINDSDDIMSADNLVRLKEVLEFHFQLDNKTVFTDDNRKLGKVSDYATDTASFYVMKLHVRPSLLQSLGSAELVINRTQIVSVTNEKIVVQRPVVKEEATAPALHQHIENPFRKARPQAEASDIHRASNN